MMYRKSLFTPFARSVSRAAGHPATFVAAIAIILAWSISGPLFHFSDTWQLVINTGTTIVTFLMVFLIQNTQNRDIDAIHIKLDELIRASENAHNALLNLEEMTEEEIEETKRKYCELAEKARRGIKKGEKDTGSPNV